MERPSIPTSCASISALFDDGGYLPESLRETAAGGSYGSIPFYPRRPAHRGTVACAGVGCACHQWLLCALCV